MFMDALATNQNPPIYRLYMCLADKNGNSTSKDYPEEMTLKGLLIEMDIAIHMSNVERVELFHIICPGQVSEYKYLIGELPSGRRGEG
jgi:hypothetical protein